MYGEDRGVLAVSTVEGIMTGISPIIWLEMLVTGVCWCFDCGYVG